jgi:hypothetical protein
MPWAACVTARTTGRHAISMHFLERLARTHEMEGKHMKMAIPLELKPALLGFAGGAVAAMIIGFSFGGWVRGGKAEAAAVERADMAVVSALAPICVDKFQRATDAGANLTALKAADSWTRGELLEKGGWVAMPGVMAPGRVSDVAKACALLLVPA